MLFTPGADPVLDKEISSLKKASLDGHAGEEETSMMYFLRPDLVHLDVIGTESGLDQGRLDMLPHGYTGIWWYARYPNHFASDITNADKKLGELLISKDAGQLAELIRFFKHNDNIEQLQKEFSDRSDNPLK